MNTETKPVAKFVSGPYTAVRDECHYGTLSEINGGEAVEKQGLSHELIVQVGGWCSLERQEATTRLLAAAPKLYGALKFILAFYEPDANKYLDTEAWKRAEAGARYAMAEARGEV